MPDDVQNDDRDSEWYRERLPRREELLELLGDDPSATLIQTAKQRAVADGTIAVTAGPAVDGEEEVRRLVERATEVVVKLTEKPGPIALTSDERAVLDAVVLVVARPALFVRDGKVLRPPPNWPSIQSDHALIEANLRGVGCVVARNKPGGTAVLVSEKHALTNNHVVCWLMGRPPRTWQDEPEYFAKELATHNAEWSKDPASAPEVDFLRELGQTATSRVRIAKVVGSHATADLAVLELATVPKTRPVPLHPNAPASIPGHAVYAVGYPMVDRSGATPLFLLETIFGGGETLSTKRVSPGYLKELESDVRLVHDASTLNGSSGSALFDFVSHEMIGLHYGGMFQAKANYAVPMWRLVKDAVLTENAIRFSNE